jgi:hypothetical protein
VSLWRKQDVTASILTAMNIINIQSVNPSPLLCFADRAPPKRLREGAELCESEGRREGEKWIY